MSAIETMGASLGRLTRSIKRGGSIAFLGIASAGCFMAAVGSGMNRNPIVSVVMLAAALYCICRMVKEARTKPNSI